ncbi:MAG: T9SS type A sorting domain-containing protein [Fulvivirga sp.]
MNRFDDESLEPKVNNIKLFPNPTTDFLRVRIENSTLTEANFTVHNIIGNKIDVEIEPVGENEFRIKVKDLVPGYYLLAIRDKQGYFKEAYKFLKR